MTMVSIVIILNALYLMLMTLHEGGRAGFTVQ